MSDQNVENAATSRPPWAERHREALAQGDETYVDPASGYQVFTEVFHQRRGSCCGSGCRHCPFGHENVPAERRAAIAGTSES